MKLNDKALFRFMEHIEASGVSGASFDDTVEALNAMYSTMKQNENTTFKKIGVTIPEREFMLAIMLEEGLVRGRFHKDGVSGLHLTFKGHEWLRAERRNTFSKRLGRWFERQFGQVLVHVVLPVLTAIFTVLVMQYFELSVAEPVACEENVLCATND